MNNTTIWSWNSDPFGKTAANDDPDNNKRKFIFNLRFAGQYYDVETGLHYNYFRDYDPSTGRYVQSDPIGLAGGLNTYGYVGGNPLSYNDSLGLLPSDYTAAETIINSLAKDGHFSVPPEFYMGLTAVQDATGVTGATDYSWQSDSQNRITITDKYYDRCISDSEAKNLLGTYIHETLHYNQSLSEELLQYYFQDDPYFGSGKGMGDSIHDDIYRREKNYTNMLFDKYNKLRKKQYQDDVNSGLETNKCGCK